MTDPSNHHHQPTTCPPNNKQAFVPQSVLDAEAVAAICKEYRIHNADVHLRCDASVDQVRFLFFSFFSFSFF